MARPKYTYAQLEAAHHKQQKAIARVKENVKHWKERARAAEIKLGQYVIVDDKPDYFFSVSGFSLFRRYYRTYGLTAKQIEILLMVSYVETFFAIDYNIFRHSMIGLQDRLDELVELRYIIIVRFPAKNSFKRKRGYVLTQRGKDLINDYKKYYDEKMEEIRNKHVTQLTFEDGAYFKRTRLNRYFRRLEQGGGPLIRGKFNDIFRDNDVTKE